MLGNELGLTGKANTLRLGRGATTPVASRILRLQGAKKLSVILGLALLAVLLRPTTACAQSANAADAKDGNSTVISQSTAANGNAPLTLTYADALERAVPQSRLCLRATENDRAVQLHGGLGFLHRVR